ncbi:MAG: VIT1/CCC1 transporter family protein [Candidatus Diapherotrites archaeon]|nr:VIT1/CCC1 transporter family protein [Candidatus Diapherotrites archaeon]
MTGKSIAEELLALQQNEITENLVYLRLAGREKNAKNRRILTQIAADELRHYNFWKKHTGKELKPNMFLARAYSLVSGVFGLTFGLKLMEKGEELAQINYAKIAKSIPEAKRILEDEDRHEMELLGMLDEEKLEYAGSMVLGLNDALVELTGALAGLTLALQNSKLIALVGLVTGIAATLSMAASEYLSTKSEETRRNPFKAAVYTGIAYIFAVFFLILPYFVFSNPLLSLACTLAVAIAIIFIFTFYISVAKDYSFKKRFIEMAAISLGVALVSFAIGFALKLFLGI